MAEILSLDQNGKRLIPLVPGGCTAAEARVRLSNQKASQLFADANAPEEALAGLWLYFSCAEEECHEIVQNLETREAYFWHGILHRQEPLLFDHCARRRS